MFTLPSPLHPAIVHFPIVLLLLGAVIAVAAVAIRRVSLQAFTASVLLLGTVGSYVAAETGEDDENKAKRAGPTAKAVFETHEEWAERTETAATVAAGLGLASLGLGIWVSRRTTTAPVGWLSSNALGLTLRSATAAAALVASYCVFEAGHAGGKLVYEHGVGVKTSAAAVSATTVRGDND